MANIEKSIVFLHAPKTGGNTFNDLLKNLEIENNMNYHQWGVQGIIPKFNSKYFKSSKLLDIFSGHFVFSDECKYFDLFTLVRDVHKTFFSNLYFFYFKTFKEDLKNLKNINYIENNFKINLNFTTSDSSTIIELINNNYITSNPFTKIFAGIPFEKFFYVQKDYKINDNDFKTALNNFNYFKLIGHLDNIDLFFKKFISLYGFKAKSYTSQNIAKYDRSFIDLMIKNTFNEIAEYNSYDLNLVQKVLKFNRNLI